MKQELRAFYNRPSIKKKYLARVQAHAEADEIIKGTYWENGRGCAVGCTIHGSDYKAYETELGIPEWLARLEDTIFEGLPLDRAKLWPEEFLKATPVGAELDKIKGPFLVFVLQSTLYTFDHEKFPKILQAISSVIDLWTIREATLEDFEEAARTARAEAVWAAEAAKEDAARAEAASAVWAAWAAEAAAEVAVAQAAVAQAAEVAAQAVWAAEAAAEDQVYVKFADKLLELLRECK